MKVEQALGGSLSRLCLLSGYSRQAYYKRRLLEEHVPLKEDLLVQQVIGYRELQPHIGGRKLYFLMGPFMKLHCLSIGRDGFFRMLGKYGLLNKRRRGKPQTTDSNHWMKKYPDLSKKLVPVRSEQVWVSDITYLELCNQDAYLSLITDAYSRKIVGFYVSESLAAEGCICALQMALDGRKGNEELMHHSDRGTQYCCNDYVKMLQDNGVNISMTQSGDPRDNAIAERVNGILKMELLKPSFTDLDDARAAVMQAVNIYNYLRPHSSISMLTPALVHTRKLKVKRCWKNYYKKKPGKEAVREG
ncbi:IS3 family transposase [Mucilaginibacter psychrotolerans]|uniref:IS3 family transposase n=1 Tax=Mucilaginibacter psychrotolerans TaxID=1524096 RepID=A0A4Y8S824_9SPHI|nr:IS3 family transposase [Mucilaginibacter psychrotolerans]TFF34765.1 IS3 family transposase [Mucilaginibacter psychrotolerans]